MVRIERARGSACLAVNGAVGVALGECLGEAADEEAKLLSIAAAMDSITNRSESVLLLASLKPTSPLYTCECL